MFFEQGQRGTKLAKSSPMLAWIALLPLTGCLMPPAVDEVPAAINQPPRIVPEALEPAPAEGALTLSTECAYYRFFAAVSDPDPDDTIYWRYFVDYELEPRPETTEVRTLSPEPGSVARALEFRVDPLGESPVRFRAVNVHTVELLVADRPFEDSEREPRGRRLADTEGLTDTYTWAVELTPLEDLECVQPR